MHALKEKRTEFLSNNTMGAMRADEPSLRRQQAASRMKSVYYGRLTSLGSNTKGGVTLSQILRRDDAKSV
jgi:hypothetical protein